MKPNWKRGELGQGVVEFAVIFLPVLFLVMIIIDGGLLMSRYNTLTHGSREGARIASTGASLAEVCDRVRAQSQGLVDNGDPCNGSSACGGARPSICVQYSAGPAPSSQLAGEVGSTVKVRVRYAYEPLIPIFGAVADIDFDTCSVARLERPLTSVSASGSNTC